jgi:hypothetical protein
MKRTALLLVSLAACSDDGGSAQNPPVLWLGLDGRETEVRLVPEEPRPY